MILHAYGDSWTEGEGCNLNEESKLKNQDLIMEALYVDANSSTIKVSTNKKNEGQPIDKILDNDLVNREQPSLSEKKNQLFCVYSIFSADQKIGTLVLSLENNN